VNALDRLRSLFATRAWTRQGAEGPSFLERSRLIAFLLFIVTVTGIVLISYEGVSASHLPALPGQIATVSVHSSAPFSFQSKEQTRLLGEHLKDRVPPVYRLDMRVYQQFEKHLLELLDRLDGLERQFPIRVPGLNDRRAVLAKIVGEFNARGPYRASVDDIALLLEAGDAAARRALASRSLVVLREIHSEGMHDSTLNQGSEAGAVTIFQLLTPEGDVVQRPVQSLEEALIFLRVNLGAEGTSAEVSKALFRLFRNGLTPNLLFDEAASRRREAEALRSLRPVTVEVERGQAIIEAGTRITPDQYEMLLAHREFVHQRGESATDEGLQLFSRVLMVLAMVAACILYIRIEDPDTLRSNVRLGLLALVVIVNLALVRLTYSLLDLDFFVHNPTWASTLPYFAPAAMAPLIVAILIDAGSGIFMALFISLFTGVIYGNRFDVQVTAFLASVVAIYGCNSVRKRSSVVSAGAAAGLVVCLTTFILGLVSQTALPILLKQMAAGLLTGVLTGVAVVGLLPVLEALFRRTTDITLLELTDFNHPLLRRMQMETPGTYHHSLVVAQLSENAAAAIGANPLLARVCALYHDIGKTNAPDFFSENQDGGTNPHDALLPERSAEIIRKHVEDGLALAHKYRLPKAVADAIRQHHGTSLIRFFHQKAGSPADDSAFRYPGPKPAFKESAIIALADTVEAAARAQKQAEPGTLSELIDTLLRERLEEGQLDQAPITLAELARVRESLKHTLLNMLHSRIQYPRSK
jgi:putative nucleotidyltransferase with HDIG domain